MQNNKIEVVSAQDKADLLSEISKYAVLISEATEDDVFFDYDPNVDSITVRIHEGGWPRDATARYHLYFDYNADEIKAVRDVLKGMLVETIYTTDSNGHGADK